jgi:hypothetical protein
LAVFIAFFSVGAAGMMAWLGARTLPVSCVRIQEGARGIGNDTSNTEWLLTAEKFKTSFPRKRESMLSH